MGLNRLDAVTLPTIQMTAMTDPVFTSYKSPITNPFLMLRLLVASSKLSVVCPVSSDLSRLLPALCSSLQPFNVSTLRDLSTLNPQLST